jgi:hypothetical protein
MLKKIFPSLVGNSAARSFKLILLAEGYTAGQSAQFAADCLSFTEQLLATPPFNLTRINPNWITVYSLFSVSANAGPASGTATAGRTAYESAIDPGTGALTVNPAKVNAMVAAEQIDVNGTATPLADFCAKGAPSYGSSGVLIAVLLPSVVTPAQGAEMEYAPAPDDYHFVATTQNGRWPQLIFRAMGRCLGLGDEYELDGPDQLAPPDTMQYAPPFNLELYRSPPVLNDASAKWTWLMAATRRQGPADVHAKMGLPATADYSVNAVPETPVTIEYWEGGAGYRTQIYRTAKDCLMRRRIGDSRLPVRGDPVPFCLSCRKFIEHVIT